MPEQEISIVQATTPRNYKSFEEKLGCRGCTIDNPKWKRHSDVFALVLLVLVGWAIGYSLFGSSVVGIQSQMFSLVVSKPVFLFIALRIFNLKIIFVGTFYCSQTRRGNSILNTNSSYGGDVISGASDEKRWIYQLE